MKYYKLDSIPLEEVTLELGQRAFDEFGNYVEGDAFGGSAIITRSALNDGERVDKFENEKFLIAFWAITNKNI
jgi:hypothetical protein